MSHPTVPDPILARRRRSRGRTAATVAIACLALAACGSDAASSEPTPSAESGRPAYGLVSPEQAATLAADSGVTVLDVRTPDEFAEDTSTARCWWTSARRRSPTRSLSSTRRSPTSSTATAATGRARRSQRCSRRASRSCGTSPAASPPGPPQASPWHLTTVSGDSAA